MREQVRGPSPRQNVRRLGPQPGGQAAPLLDKVVEELRRDATSLLVQARDDGLAETYLRYGAVQPNPREPRHLVWLAWRQCEGPVRGGRADLQDRSVDWRRWLVV